MQIGFDINLVQTQKLIMTPELRQAIKILQLSAADLLQFLDNAMLENPLLEIPEEDDQEENIKAPEKEKSNSDELYEYLSGESGYSSGENWSKDDEEKSYERFVAQPPDLVEFLTRQLHLSTSDPTELKVGEFLIGNINDDGYLQIELEEVAQACQEPPQLVERVLQIIQSFDPPGVAARDLPESLLIQLEQRGLRTPLLEKLVRCHLRDLAEGRLQKIAASLGISPREVQLKADLIKTLDPKPGRNFTSAGETRYIIPDVVVKKVGSEFVVLVNDISVPRLIVNKTYQTLLKRHDLCDTQTAQFIENKLKSAVWLIRSVEQRRMTLYKVVLCIVDYQREFFERGVKYLKALALRQIAEQAGLHESTISRAIANKYIQTPQGVFELKYFFSSGVENARDGETIAANSIKRIMKELVEKEDSHKPLSDQQICQLLQERGIRIARRTVAKYRRETGILPVRQRRRI